MTGAAGFIGFHISKRLLDEGWRIIGLDCMSDYYDVALKERRESMLLQNASYKSIHEKVETRNLLVDLFADERPDVVIHLAAQAGVRYSIENPRAYLESNINGTFELLEAARAFPPQHMLLSSTSSVYGANEDMPYKENNKVDVSNVVLRLSKSQQSIFAIHTTYPSQCFVFLLYMGHRGDQIWPQTNLLKQFLKAGLLMFIIRVKCGVTLYRRFS